MNIIKIIIKEVKQVFRDKITLSLIVMLPIVLIFILGMALSKTFTSDEKITKVEAIYINEDTGELGKSFDNFIKNMESINVSFKKVEDVNEGKKSIKNNKYDCLIEINKGYKEIKIYKNSEINFKGDLVESVLRSYVNRYNVVNEVAKINPVYVKKILSQGNNQNYVNIQSLNKKKTPTSVGYYAVTMLTLAIMYASLSASNSITLEKVRKTWNRVIASPIKKYQLFVGKTLGQFLSIVIQMTVIIVASKLLLNAYWGEDIFSVYLIILSEAFFTISLGIGIGFITKSPEIAPGILSAIIPFMIFMGGGYFPINTIDNNILQGIANVSPIKWVNDALFKIIYANDYSYMGIAIAINMVAGLIFLMISVNAMRKES